MHPWQSASTVVIIGQYRLSPKWLIISRYWLSADYWCISSPRHWNHHHHSMDVSTTNSSIACYSYRFVCDTDALSIITKLCHYSLDLRLALLNVTVSRNWGGGWIVTCTVMYDSQILLRSVLDWADTLTQSHHHFTGGSCNAPANGSGLTIHWRLKLTELDATISYFLGREETWDVALSQYPYMQVVIVVFTILLDSSWIFCKAVNQVSFLSYRIAVKVFLCILFWCGCCYYIWLILTGENGAILASKQLRC